MEGRLNELAAAVGLHESRVRLTAAELNALRRRQESQTVSAPTAGRVIQLVRKPGSYVRRGDQVALFERDEARSIQAFMTQEEILEIGLDDPATVYFPSLDERVRAVVVAVDRTTGFVDEMEAQYTWRGPHDRSARVTLAIVGLDLESVRRRYPAGLPATVVFERRTTSELASSVSAKIEAPITRIKFPDDTAVKGDDI